MKILIAEDDRVSRRILETTLTGWGYQTILTEDGNAAWNVLKARDAPELAILDVMMPEVDGFEICRRVRESNAFVPPYIILLTGMSQKEDVVHGIKSGANDYLSKPFYREELKVRVEVGIQMLELQKSLSERVKELEVALAEVKQLRGLVPICSYCKNVRNDENFWQQVETYISSRTDAVFSHSICPGCFEQVVKPQLTKLRSERVQVDRSESTQG